MLAQHVGASPSAIGKARAIVYGYGCEHTQNKRKRDRRSKGVVQLTSMSPRGCLMELARPRCPGVV